MEYKLLQVSRNHRTLYPGLILLMLLFFMQPVTEAQNILTHGDVAKIKSVTGVEISPDGFHIAYNLRMLRWFDAYLMTGNRSAEVPHWDVKAEIK